jgi:hypothetical protein
MAGTASWRQVQEAVVRSGAASKTNAAKIAGGATRLTSTVWQVSLAAAIRPRRAGRLCIAGFRPVARHGSLSQAS